MRRVAALMAAIALTLAAAQAAEPIRYTVAISGIGNKALEDAVKAQSNLVALEDKGAPSLTALRLRADDDRGRIDAVLRAEGYYEARITTSVDRALKPVAVAVKIETGPAFTLAAYDVELHGAPPPQPVWPDRLGIELGGRARSAAVVKAQQTLLHDLADQGYPLAKVADRTVVVDHLSKTMRVRLVVEAGGLAHFGELHIEGLKRVTRSWVLNRVPWKPGQRFNVALMEEFRKHLVDSRLFSSVRLSTATKLGPDGRLPVTAALTEAKDRSVGFGASWSSTEGFGGNAYWEDRNLFGGAERLRADLIASQIRDALDLSYTGPDFLRPNQDLIGAVQAEEETTDAFFSRTIGGSLGLSWLLADIWRPSVSAAMERTLEEQRNVGELPIGRTYLLFSTPMELRRDSSNDLLDPSRGNRLDVTDQPFFRMFGSSASFNRAEIYDAQYFQLLDRPRLVLANWQRLGAIQGAGILDIPALHRFYVGGAGSVRGFGFQMAGPLDPEGRPVGGRSALSFGSEVRIKVTDTVGVVPFAEGGRSYLGAWPTLDQQLFWGAGLGLRYYTPIGPVRADIAFPLNPRPGVDSKYQIYLSLGQAF